MRLGKSAVTHCLECQWGKNGSGSCPWQRTGAKSGCFEGVTIRRKKPVEDEGAFGG